MSLVDTAIIDRIYAPVTGRIAERFGVDQWRLSIECLNGTIVFWLAGVAITIAGKGMGEAIFVDLLGALLWLGFMERVRRVAHRQAASSLGRQTARMTESIFRHIMVGLLPLSLYYLSGLDQFCHIVALLLFISHLYFKTCDAPPPRTRRYGRVQPALRRC